MGLSIGATDNLVRDLANLGHVEANRKETKIVPAFHSEQQALDLALAYWNAHEIVRRLREKAMHGTLPADRFTQIYEEANKREELGAKTIAVYAVRVLGWLHGLGITSQIGKTLVVADSSQKGLSSLSEVPDSRRASDIFLGQAPPHKVVAAFQHLCTSKPSRLEMEEAHGRNTFSCLVSLGLARPDGTPLAEATTSQASLVVATRAASRPTVRAAIELVTAKEGLSGLEVGQHLAERFETQWSEGSQRRNGTALRQWAAWSLSLTK